jgi:hypothetical protein
MVIECFMKSKRDDCCPGVQASGSTTQELEGPDVPNRVTIDTVDVIQQVVPVNDGGFRVLCDGLYFVMAAPQVGSAQQGPASNFRCWIRVNGEDVDNSNVLMSLRPNGETKDVIVSQGAIPLKAGDLVEVYAATDADTGQVMLEAIQPTPNEPLVPSIIFSMVWECELHQRRPRRGGC